MSKYQSIRVSESEADALIACSKRLPSTDTHSTENTEFNHLAPLELHSHPDISAMHQRIHCSLTESGFVIIDFAQLGELVDLETDRTAITGVLAMIGAPIQVFALRPLWKPIYTNTAIEPWRAGGVGFIPLHMDFVNAQHPPEYSCLFCVQPDPLGGGESIVARTDGAGRLLSTGDATLLRESVFSDGKVVDLHHIGADINPFAVLTGDSTWPMRFSGKMLMTMANSPHKAALQSLNEHLESMKTNFQLRRFEIVVVDQRVAVHGREALNAGQADIPEARRRVLHQVFLRANPRR